MQKKVARCFHSVFLAVVFFFTRIMNYNGSNVNWIQSFSSSSNIPYHADSHIHIQKYYQKCPFIILDCYIYYMKTIFFFSSTLSLHAAVFLALVSKYQENIYDWGYIGIKPNERQKKSIQHTMYTYLVTFCSIEHTNRDGKKLQKKKLCKIFMKNLTQICLCVFVDLVQTKQMYKTIQHKRNNNSS